MQKSPTSGDHWGKYPVEESSLSGFYISSFQSCPIAKNTHRMLFCCILWRAASLCLRKNSQNIADMVIFICIIAQLNWTQIIRLQVQCESRCEERERKRSCRRSALPACIVQLRRLLFSRRWNKNGGTLMNNLHWLLFIRCCLKLHSQVPTWCYKNENF